MLLLEFYKKIKATHNLWIFNWAPKQPAPNRTKNPFFLRRKKMCIFCLKFFICLKCFVGSPAGWIGTNWNVCRLSRLSINLRRIQSLAIKLPSARNCIDKYHIKLYTRWKTPDLFIFSYSEWFVRKTPADSCILAIVWLRQEVISVGLFST